MKDIRQTVLDYFIEDRHGFYRGDTLFYKLKIIDKKPEVYEINCNVERGITCCRIKAMPFGKIVFGIEVLFPRYVYFKVANFLRSFDLYDEVIEWYESLQKRETRKDV